jgi:hypothetical protein
MQMDKIKLMSMQQINLLIKVRGFKNLLECFLQLNLNSKLIMDKNKNKQYNNLFQGLLDQFFLKNGEIF